MVIVLTCHLSDKLKIHRSKYKLFPQKLSLDMILDRKMVNFQFFGFSSIFTNVSWCQICLLDLRWNVLVHHFQFRKTFWNFWHDRFLKTFGATVQYCGVCSLFVSEWGWQHKELFLRSVNPKETSRKKQAFQVWLNVVVKDSTQKLWFLVGGL